MSRDPPLIDRARSALADARWEVAHALLLELQEARRLAPAELELLAGAAYGAGRFEEAVSAFEAAHAGYLEADDLLAAASAATSVATYLMMDTGLMAPVRGWTRRAERLLEGCDESPVHAWLAMVRTYERFLSGDAAGAASQARRTVEIGLRQGAAAPVAVARVAGARLLILAGQVDEGLAQLDEVATVVISGELEALPAGMVFCELICAMQALAQYDRAEEWTDAMDRWSQSHAFGGLGGRCRVHRAEILRLRGSCAEAEAEALHACEELRPWMRREFGWPLTELGTIRLRRGDHDGAEAAFLEAHRHGWDPQPGLASLRLARGDAHGAAALLDDALRHPSRVPSKERPPHGELERAPLLQTQVQAAVAAGDLATATAAAEELTTIAERFRSRALAAGAALARTRVALAGGRVDEAVTAGADAVAGWSEVGAPFETATARLLLACAHDRRGDAAVARVERRAADDTFTAIGACPHPADLPPLTAASSPVGPARHAASSVVARAVFRCEGDTRRVEFEGHTVLLRDLKGSRYLARMLAEPAREFHVLDLVAAERGSSPPAGARWSDLSLAAGHGGPLLDATAKAAYRRRLRETEADIEEAERYGDDDRVALASADRAFIIAELARAVGLGGRDRHAGSDAERARTSVTRAVRYALARIAEHHRELSEHLGRAVRTGTYCAYDPDPRAPIAWET